MRIVINHLTRMRTGYICAAGINLATNRHVRPMPGVGENLNTTFLVRHGGCFELGATLDLGPVEPHSHPPEIEDHRFEPRRVRSVCEPVADHFWHLLRRVARPLLSDIFGPDLRQDGRRGVINLGKGRASLGCLCLDSPTRLYLDDENHLRMSINNGDYHLELSLTDLRFYEADHQTVRQPVLEQAAEWCAQNRPLILSVGLSRPFHRPGDSASRHWLQVNNLHWEHAPLWNP